MTTAGALLDPRNVVLRWDLDKTYLRTEFDTVRDLLRTAFEGAQKKRALPGAAVLLRELRTRDPAGIHILSGSPEQMRRVLEAKLRLDGIQWNTFTLKPSLRNIVRGRFRFVREQLGYKLLALLSSRVELDVALDEVLFGDDAEADAFIYSLYADLCAGRVGPQTLLEVLLRARLYADDIGPIVRLAERLPRRDSCRKIFIHLDRISPPEVFADLGRRVCPFYNYFQPALVLLELGLLEPEQSLRVAAVLAIEHSFGPDALLASYLDLVSRGQVGRGAGEKLLAWAQGQTFGQFAQAAEVVESFVTAIAKEMERTTILELSAQSEAPVDYVALFSRERERARAARRRRTIKRMR